MAESGQSARFQSQPPPAPPLPPNRAGVFQRIIAPLSFNRASRPQLSQTSQSISVSPRNVSGVPQHRHLPSQTVAHRTGLEIAAVDINDQKTHAILAGKEILKTIKVSGGRAVEDVNVRSAVYSAAATHQSRPEEVNSRRQFLPAKDVRWSHGHYAHVVATAAQNGRIALYDVSAIGSSRVELSWLYLHTGQVNKLDFDPHRGYMLLSGSQDKTCKIWDIRNPRAPSPYNQYNVRAPVRDVRWSPTDAYEFALCTESGVIQKWDVRNPSQAQLSINAHEKACYTIGWHPDGKHLVSGGLDKHVRVWDFKSENRRQKPMFQLRTPQGVMNLAWRPPSWSQTLGEASQWQSTQLATGYTDEDPRVHVWDFRRPLLPLHEIDKYDSRPTDMLWASDNLLWTVGYAGMFTQTDVTHATPVEEELPPCAMDWLPDGSFVAFAEERWGLNESSLDEPVSNLLSVPNDKLSGEDGVTSRSLTDDEETELVLGGIGRRLSKGTSSRSAKSQGSSPPVGDGFPLVLSLEKAVATKGNLFRNNQVGTFCHIDGTGIESNVFSFLADNYARPMTESERQSEPGRILQRLEEAFMRNADVCDTASMHRTAQSWRILSAVIVPELKEWADKNKKARQEQEVKRKAKLTEKLRGQASNSASPFAKLTSKLAETKSPARSDKMMSSLFRNVVDVEKGSHDPASTSNMTTPLAKPLPDSPVGGTTNKDSALWQTLNDTIEPMPPLPPSVISAHSTAAAASRALLDGASDTTSSSTSSPEKPRLLISSNSALDSQRPVSSSRSRPNTPATKSGKGQDVSPYVPASPLPHRIQEERRAALKDYRPQARTVFTLEEPKSKPKYDLAKRHDSGESFPMFSASTDSSRKATSWDLSFGTSGDVSEVRKNSEDWQVLKAYDYTPPSGPIETANTRIRNHQPQPDILFSSETTESADSPELAFSMDGPYDLLKTSSNTSQGNGRDRTGPEKPEPLRSSSTIWKPEGSENSTNSAEPVAAQSDVDVDETYLDDGTTTTLYGPRIYYSNPNKVQTNDERKASSGSAQFPEAYMSASVDLSTDDYLYQDFSPIDFVKYEPMLPFAWSSLPLICQIIEFDINEGVAVGFFSSQLLLHIHPFFFHQSFRAHFRHDLPAPNTLAGRLMRPDLNARVIENLFARHMDYLRSRKLYRPMAELRKFCFEFDYPHLYKTDTASQPVGSTLSKDSVLLHSSCSECYALMAPGENVCRNCKRRRDLCPVCEATDDTALQSTSIDVQLETDTTPHTGPSKLWTFCHKCGHSAHLNCMSKWFTIPEAEGQCPTRNCGCDCGPGAVREVRIAKQRKAADDSDAIRHSQSQSNIPKRDPVKVSPSPAVNKARNSLRSSGVSLTSDRGTQSGDESTTGHRHSHLSRNDSMGRGSGLGRSDSTTRNSISSMRQESSFGSRPRVRVVRPGEESIS